MIWFLLGGALTLFGAAGAGAFLGASHQWKKDLKLLQEERGRLPVSPEDHAALRRELEAVQSRLKRAEDLLDPTQEICSCDHPLYAHGAEGCRGVKGWGCNCCLNDVRVLALLERRRAALEAQQDSSMPLLQDVVSQREETP